MKTFNENSWNTNYVWLIKHRTRNTADHQHPKESTDKAMFIYACDT